MAAVATYITTLISDSVEATTYTFTNGVVVPTGGGIIALFVSTTTSARTDVSTVTLNGTSMTKIDDVGSGGFETLTSWHLPAGIAAGTYTLVVTMAGDIGGSGPPNVTVPIWCITGANSTPFAHGTSSGSTSVAINTAASGCAIYAVEGSANPTSFSSATTRSGPTAGFMYKMAGDLVTSSATPHTESAGTSNFFMAGVSWQVGAVTVTDTLTQGSFTFVAKTLGEIFKTVDVLTKATFTFVAKTIGDGVQTKDTLTTKTFAFLAQVFGETLITYTHTHDHFKTSYPTDKKQVITHQYDANHALWGEVPTGFFIRDSFHSPKPDSDNTVTNKRVNKKWWSRLLNG